MVIKHDYFISNCEFNTDQFANLLNINLMSDSLNYDNVKHIILCFDMKNNFLIEEANIKSFISSIFKTFLQQNLNLIKLTILKFSTSCEIVWSSFFNEDSDLDSIINREIYYEDSSSIYECFEKVNEILNIRKLPTFVITISTNIFENLSEELVDNYIQRIKISNKLTSFYFLTLYSSNLYFIEKNEEYIYFNDFDFLLKSMSTILVKIQNTIAFNIEIKEKENLLLKNIYISPKLTNSILFGSLTLQNFFLNQKYSICLIPFGALRSKNVYDIIFKKDIYLTYNLLNGEYVEVKLKLDKFIRDSITVDFFIINSLNLTCNLLREILKSNHEGKNSLIKNNELQMFNDEITHLCKIPKNEFTKKITEKINSHITYINIILRDMLKNNDDDSENNIKSIINDQFKQYEFCTNYDYENLFYKNFLSNYNKTKTFFSCRINSPIEMIFDKNSISFDDFKDLKFVESLDFFDKFTHFTQKDAILDKKRKNKSNLLTNLKKNKIF